MNIRNYTSGIGVETTIARIEAKLAAAGATGIMKLYDDNKQVSSLAFETNLGGKKYAIKVPANVNACFEALWKEHCLHHSRPRESTKETLRDQAARTAWKLVQDWIDVQISMIVMKQAEFLEVFMPYVWDGERTHFQIVMDNKFKALPEKT